MLHWWTYLRSMGSNFHEVVKGELYRGATPEPKNLEKWHKKYGIKTWIDLRLPADCGFGSSIPNDRTRLFAGQIRKCEELGLARIAIPISDREPTDQFDINQCLRLMGDTTLHPVFVACQGGRHRTGEMVALYGQRFLGWDEDDVKEHLKQGGFYPNGHERFARALEKLLGFALLLLCLVVPAYGQKLERWRPLVINGPNSATVGPVQIGREPVFTSDEARVVWDISVQARGNPVRGALAGVRTLRPPKIRSDQHDPSRPWWDVELRFVPLRGALAGVRTLRPHAIPPTLTRRVPTKGVVGTRHPYIRIAEAGALKSPPQSGGSTILEGERRALPASTARPENVYGEAGGKSDAGRATRLGRRPFDSTYWIPFGLALGASAADWHSTKRALDRGYLESNPLFRADGGRGVRWAANVGVTGALLGYTAWLERRGHRVVARVLLWTVAGLRFGAAIHNYTIVR